jgi:hypothetical protein
MQISAYRLSQIGKAMLKKSGQAICPVFIPDPGMEQSGPRTDKQKDHSDGQQYPWPFQVGIEGGQGRKVHNNSILKWKLRKVSVMPVISTLFSERESSRIQDSRIERLLHRPPFLFMRFQVTALMQTRRSPVWPAWRLLIT